MEQMLKFIKQIKDGKKLSNSQDGIKEVLTKKFQDAYNDMKVELK